MKRYFESFYNADPMDELGEAAAHQLGNAQREKRSIARVDRARSLAAA